MASSLDDIEFLARSEHRFRVLGELSERPCERAELQERTEVTRTTISRTLSDMEGKGWVESEGWQYRLTPLGEMMYEEFARALDTADTVRTLNRVIEWVPTEALDIDLRHFHDATVSVASRTDPTLPVRRFTGLKAADGHVQALIYALDPFQLAAHRRATEVSNQRVEVVFSADFYRKLQDNPDIARDVSQVAASDQYDFYLCDEEPPIQLVVAEDTVGLLLTGTDGTFPAYVESRNEAVAA
ncbi:helix-turn-helix transcriptional regulator [Haladaptatus sp.]|uniref:helix-turn-helix transcriptional regulator n=1 Tax=Haladaptatus sp. TaxID=1973141 RepID=UPI003C4DF6AD